MEKNYTKTVFSGFTIIFMMTVLGAVLSYVFRLVLARNLTVAEYGLFYAIYAAFSIVFILRDIGSGSAVIKYIPEFLIKKKFGQLKLSIFLATLTTAASSIILSVLVMICSQSIARDYVKDVNQTFFIIMMAIMFLLLSFDALIVNLLVGFQKYHEYAIVQFLRQALPLIFVLLLFLMGKHAEYVAYAFILSSICVVSISGMRLLRHINTFNGAISSIAKNKPLLGNMLMFGVSVTFVSIGGVILQATDTVMITFFLGTTASGIYNAALPIANMLIYVSGALVTITFPLTAELWARRLKSKIIVGLSFFYKYAVLAILPFVVVVFAFADLMISLLFTPTYINAAPALRVLIIGCFFFFLTQINFSILSGIGKPKTIAAITLSGAVLNVLLNFLLIPAYGIIGAAIATTCSYGVMLLTSFVFLRKNLAINIPILHWIKTVVLSFILLGIVMVLKKILIMNPIIEIIVIVAIGVSVYIGLAFLIQQITVKEIKEVIIILKKKE